MLWACLLLPSLSLDVFARAASPADALMPFAVGSGGRAPRIVDANACARDAGIRPGQLVSASLALSPGLVLRERDPKAESAALEAVASWATQFTPTVALAPPDAVLAEIGGSLRLFDGLPKLTGLLTRGARDLGYAARFALAPTSAAALLFARATAADGYRLSGTLAGKTGATGQPMSAPEFAATPMPDPQAWLDALLPLPLAFTEADPAAVATLAAAGITTFGQACALPRAALARRVGADFVAILDRVRGFVPEPRLPFVPPPRYTGKLDLPAPVASVDALAFAVNRLVLELAGWLNGRGLGVTEMSLALAHERYVGVATGVSATTARFALAAPAREPAHLVVVLRERLARIVLPAPVEAITLASEATAPLVSRNLGLLPGDEAVATSSAARPLARAAGRRRGDARRAARRAPARARVAQRENRGPTTFSRNNGRSPESVARPPPCLAARRAGAARASARSATLGAAGRAGTDRVGMVGWHRRAPRLLRRRESARRDRVDLSRSPLRDRRRRMVFTRRIRVMATGSDPGEPPIPLVLPAAARSIAEMSEWLLQPSPPTSSNDDQPSVTAARTVPARSCRARRSIRSPFRPRTTHSIFARSSVTL